MPDYSSALLQRQIVLLYRNVALAQAVTVINAVLLAIVNVDSAGLAATLLWTLAALGVAAGRVFFGRLFQRDAQRHSPIFWLNASLIGAALAGLVWSAGAFLFMWSAPETLRFFTAFVLAGMIAGAVPILSAHRAAFRLYAWPIIVSVVLIFFSIGGSALAVAFGLMVVLFLLAVTRSADYFHDTLVEALHLEQDKALLIDDLQMAKAGVEQASQAKTNFLGVVSHELRTPLNGILGMADVLAMTPLNAEQTEYLSLLKQSGQGLQSIVSDILEITQIESGRVAIDRQPFAVVDLVRGIAARVQGRALAKGLAFTCEIDAAVPAGVIGDERAVARILDKLLDNAVKFTDSGQIDLQLRPGAASDGSLYLEFTIVDSGIGIDSDKQAAIFEPFGQADNSITRRFDGIGLGLAISRRLVALLGGELTVSSEPGVGSTFRLILPFSPM